MKKYNGYDELSDRKRMQHWAASKKFHDDNDKRIAELEKGGYGYPSGKEAKKSPNFTMTKKNVTGKLKIDESQLRKMVSKIIRESLRTLNEGSDYMSVLQKYGFQPMESDGDADWVPNEALNSDEAYFISVLTPQGWYHSEVYNYSEEEIFDIAEEITDALQGMGWIEDLSQRGMCGKEQYSDVAYIEAVFDGQYDDMSEGGIGTDTCGSFVVGQDGQGFWMD